MRIGDIRSSEGYIFIKGEKGKKDRRTVLSKHLLPILREVASSIDLDQSQLSKIERDKMIAPQRIITRLSKCLGIKYKKLQIKYLSDKLYKDFKNVDFNIESLEIAVKRIEKERE